MCNVTGEGFRLNEVKPFSRVGAPIFRLHTYDEKSLLVSSYQLSLMGINHEFVVFHLFQIIVSFHCYILLNKGWLIDSTI